MSETKSSAVHSLLLPLREMVLLLPNACVAEIIGYIQPEAVDDAPSWMMGYIHWRGHRLPLVSYEAMSGSEVPPVKGKLRIAVFNSVNDASELPFYAVLTQGIPRLLQASEGVVHALEQQEPLSMCSSQVQVHGETMLIPDLDEMEHLLTTMSEVDAEA